MIVNWKKEGAGALIMPCMTKNNKVEKLIYILPGYNEVPDEDWQKARPAAARHLKAGTLEEIKKEGKKLNKKQQAFKEDKDLLTTKNFPTNKVIEAVKEEGLYNTLTSIKKKETGVSNLSKKWLIDYFKETPEDWDIIVACLADAKEEVEEEEKVESIPLQDLDTNKASKIIADTFNLQTLEKWKREVSQPDLRVLILNQIEEVNKPPKGNNK